MLQTLPLTAFAALMQSLLLRLRRTTDGFPGCPSDDVGFLAGKWSAHGSAEVIDKALCDLYAMFLIEKCPPIDYGEDVSIRLRELKSLWDTSSKEIAFMTSGSTGRPKRCVHSFRTLVAECSMLAPFFAGTASFLSVVPCHHLYGFTFGLLLPACMGVPVHRTIPLPSLMMAQMREGDAIVAVPSLWAGCNFREGCGRGRIAVTATAPVSDGLLQSLKDAGFTLVDIYGSSETSVAGVRTEPGAPYALPAGIQTAGGQLIRRSSCGQETILQVQDYLQWTDERHFVPTGRIDHGVQVGGINVFPSLVASRIRGFPGVADCAVRLWPVKNRLKAFIVPAQGVDAGKLKKALVCFIRSEEFSPEERPVSLAFGRQIPVNAVGKLCDWDPRKKTFSGIGRNCT